MKEREEGCAIDSNWARRLLDERARKLAHDSRATVAAPMTAEDMLLFALGDDRYALATRFVREIILQPRLTFVPGAPPHMCGLTNLRGEVLTVVKLHHLLGHGGNSELSTSKLVVVGVEQAEFALSADGDMEVTRLDRAAFLDATHPEGSSLVRGITRDGVVVLDGSLLLADERLFIDQAVDGTSEEERRQ